MLSSAGGTTYIVVMAIDGRGGHCQCVGVGHVGGDGGGDGWC